MKTPSGTIGFIVILAFAGLLIMALRVAGQNPTRNSSPQFVLTVTGAKVKSPDDFKKLMNKLDPTGKKNKVRVNNESGKPGEDGPPFKSVTAGAAPNTATSAAASTSAVEAPVGISGVHVTQSITMSDPAELAEVAASFQ